MKFKNFQIIKLKIPPDRNLEMLYKGGIMSPVGKKLFVILIKQGLIA